MAEIKTVTDETFEEMVLQAPRPVLVDFWAAWCGPCRMLVPELEKIADKYIDSIDVMRMDVDANPGVAGALQVMTLPTVVLFRPGLPPAWTYGAMPADQLEARLGLFEYATNQAS